MTAHSHILYISCKMFHLNVNGGANICALNFRTWRCCQRGEIKNGHDCVSRKFFDKERVVHHHCYEERLFCSRRGACQQHSS